MRAAILTLAEEQREAGHLPPVAPAAAGQSDGAPPTRWRLTQLLMLAQAALGQEGLMQPHEILQIRAELERTALETLEVETGRASLIGWLVKVGLASPVNSQMIRDGQTTQLAVMVNERRA